MIRNILNFKFLKNGECKSGFTLVELIVYMGILSILLLVLSEIFVTILDTQMESEATSSVEQDGKYILTRVIYDINRAEQVVVPSNLGDQSNNLNIIIDGVNNIYNNLNNGNLQITNNNGTDNLNSLYTIVSDLQFQKIGNAGGDDTVKINFTLTSKTIRKSGPEVRNYQTTAGLRFK
ncbi:MAG: hypothetical protein A2857_02495 [Candidatus Levybacteria bacterium RIFCSPHIGHO2_01_FULL_36_15]|nr:MAG: hypothetical protein A2857_02495 [Candidatus Levybacteria bacterium RIFCSPHIGHO2_01_FULL_36_15]OGH38629.1 MAG: hypothetical protein A2905_05385 [Candidatus Levybacteria bacterium RIFCSPLOWO2_01_FULL_36_10]